MQPRRQDFARGFPDLVTCRSSLFSLSDSLLYQIRESFFHAARGTGCARLASNLHEESPGAARWFGQPRGRPLSKPRLLLTPTSNHCHRLSSRPWLRSPSPARAAARTDGDSSYVSQYAPWTTFSPLNTFPQSTQKSGFHPFPIRTLLPNSNAGLDLTRGNGILPPPWMVGKSVTKKGDGG